MCRSEYIIALDLGTTAVKAALYAADGYCISEIRREEELITPSTGWVEQDPAAWYEHICVLIHGLTKTIERKRVLGIGISSQGISFVPVDSTLKPLSNALCWLDGRARDEAEQIKDIFGEEKIFNITGKHNSSVYMLPKILWLKKNRPDEYEKAFKMLCAMDYTVARFTGNTVTEATMAAGSMMFDIFKDSWSDEIANVCGIPESLLPKVIPADTPAGLIRDTAARDFNLPEGIPLFCAGQDQKTAAYGVGISEGIATVSLGTAAAFEILINRRINWKSLELPVCPYIKNNKWVLEGCVDTAGAAIKWMNNTIVRSERYDEMDRIAGMSPPGSRGVRFFPLMTGEGSCRGINLGTRLEDMIRALYEGIAFEIKRQLEMAVKADAEIGQLNVYGGAAKSRILCRILADVSGYPVQTFKNGELCLLGAAKLTAASLGVDPEIFARNALILNSYYEPDRENLKVYQDIYIYYMNERRE
jgi:xylulokinase